jgi:hypothetical protein
MTNEFTNFIKKDIKAVCSSDCPLECETRTFGLTLSSAAYPTLDYATTLAQNPLVVSKFPNSTVITQDVLRKNILAVSIFYEELNYVKYEQSKKTSIIDLIAGFGGQFGKESDQIYLFLIGLVVL